MRDVIAFISLPLLSAAIMLLAKGVEKLHRYAEMERLRLAAEISGLRDQLREMSKTYRIADLCCLTDQDSAPSQERGIDFDVWMHDRTERAHREYMERTSRLPPCVRRTYSSEEIAKFYGISHGGID